MAIVINGSGTVTGLAVGGLPDGTVDSGTIATGTIVDADVANLAASKLTGALPAISGASLTDLPAGGITEVDVWRLTTSFSGNVNPISSNLERPDEAGAGRLGTGMSVSTGIFTFPSTGVWRIDYHSNFSINGDSRENYGYISTTTNNSTYVNAAYLDAFIQQTNSNATFNSGSCSSILDVTDVTTCKVKFTSLKVTSSVLTHGSSTYNSTFFVFTKLGET